MVPVFSNHSWGEHVVGSNQAVHVPVPVASQAPEIIVVSVASGGEAFTADPYLRGLFPSSPKPAESANSLADPIRVVFRPTKPGHFVAELNVFASWKDGHIENTRIRLDGSARNLEDAPGLTPVGQPTAPSLAPVGSPSGISTPATATPSPSSAVDAQSAKTDKDGPPSTKHAETHLSATFARAGTEITAVGDAMKRGMQVTKDVAGSFKARPESQEIWVSLAKFAVTAGMSTVASSVGLFLAQRLGNMVAAELLGTSEAVADPDTVKSLGKMMESPLKKLGEGALNRAIEKKGNENQTSTESVARFFSGQQAGIDKFVEETQHSLTSQWEKLVPLLATNPDLAVNAMRALEAVFDAHQGIAEDAQTSATANAWIAFKARDALGSETVKTNEGPTQVTQMSKARNWTHHGLKPPEQTSGLLDIHVSLRGGTLHVQSATIDGIAQPVANHLLESDLRAAKIPFRIIVEQSGAYITVDEVRRVRVSGALVLLTDDGVPSSDEARAHANAQWVVDTVLEKSLLKWGISKVTTNDVGK